MPDTELARVTFAPAPAAGADGCSSSLDEPALAQAFQRAMRVQDAWVLAHTTDVSALPAGELKGGAGRRGCGLYLSLEEGGGGGAALITAHWWPDVEAHRAWIPSPDNAEAVGHIGSLVAIEGFVMSHVRRAAGAGGLLPSGDQEEEEEEEGGFGVVRGALDAGYIATTTVEVPRRSAGGFERDVERAVARAVGGGGGGYTLRGGWEVESLEEDEAAGSPLRWWLLSAGDSAEGAAARGGLDLDEVLGAHGASVVETVRYRKLC